jgi:hypothetical protein
MGGLTTALQLLWQRLRVGGVEVCAYNPPRLDSPLAWLSRDHADPPSLTGALRSPRDCVSAIRGRAIRQRAKHRGAIQALNQRFGSCGCCAHVRRRLVGNRRAATDERHANPRCPAPSGRREATRRPDRAERNGALPPRPIDRGQRASHTVADGCLLRRHDLLHAGAL